MCVCVCVCVCVCYQKRVKTSEEGKIMSLYATRSPFLLHEICLNQRVKQTSQCHVFDGVS